MKKVIFILLSIFVTINAADKIGEKLAQLTADTEAAYFTFQENDFREIWNTLERVTTMAPDNKDAKYLTGLVGYRLANVAMLSGDKAKVEDILEKSLKALKEIEDDQQYRGEVLVVKSGLYMMKLSLTPQEAPALSAKINSMLGEALGRNANNPRALLIQGIMLYNTPEQYGGSVKKSLELFGKAKHLLENQSEEGNPYIVWGKPEAMAWMGQAYARLGMTNEARKVYEEALSEYPNFGWVRGRLLPSLSK